MCVRLFKTTSLILGKLLRVSFFNLIMEKADLTYQPPLCLHVYIQCLVFISSSDFFCVVQPVLNIKVLQPGCLVVPMLLVLELDLSIDTSAICWRSSWSAVRILPHVLWQYSPVPHLQNGSDTLYLALKSILMRTRVSNQPFLIILLFVCV